MLEVYQRKSANHLDTFDDELILDHTQREKGRFKAHLSSGEEVRVFLTRGQRLTIGEILVSECGRQLSVAGASEPTVMAVADDWEQFSKACYHLGNRHVKVQIGDCWLRITPDHVLEDMLKQIGMTLRLVNSVFVPESGAYLNQLAQDKPHHHAHQH